MSPTETEQHLSQWWPKFDHVFKFYNCFAPKGFDIVIIRKLDYDVFIGVEGGTHMMPKLGKDQMTRMLYSNELVYIETRNMFAKYVELYITDGCDCGFWCCSNSQDNKGHYSWCAKLTKPMKSNKNWWSV